MDSCPLAGERARKRRSEMRDGSEWSDGSERREGSERSCLEDFRDNAIFVMF